ncbi:exodeoxyribonuclease VII large subunit [Moritella sp. 36]|nr:exodeoxyribonuclease VII large subunit [Moritella sp. 5]QUM86407.1 exodeoxyribonuclease VII large subunit [Moritella sp. 28]QUM90632.1 exodeoxyribonuclease VII large subunit [Moritella sp. 36]
MNNTNIYTVTHLNASVRQLLESEMGTLWLTGEISNFVAPASGHWYLSLKDSRSQVRCAMFKGNNRRVTFRPANGQQVLAKVRVTMYEPRGEYQLVIESLSPAGDGLLQQQYEQLKASLDAQGYFAQAHKKALPLHAKRIGIVTSATGAAVHDILTVLERRSPNLPVIIYPTLVQGAQAAPAIVNAINIANQRNEVDLLIVGRGGGSLEDLWCFNEASVAQAIFNSQLPIISAVGHEIDVTIADFVADMRAPTPSAAAELVSQDQAHLQHQVSNLSRRLNKAIQTQLAKKQHQQRYLQQALMNQHPQRKLQQQSQKLDELSLRLNQAVNRHIGKQNLHLTQLTGRLQSHSPVHKLTAMQQQQANLQTRLHSAMQRRLQQEQNHLQNLVQQLQTVSPLATLTRGYSITQNDKHQVITSVAKLKSGDKLVTRFTDGEIRSTID